MREPFLTFLSFRCIRKLDGVKLTPRRILECLSTSFSSSMGSISTTVKLEYLSWMEVHTSAREDVDGERAVSNFPSKILAIRVSDAHPYTPASFLTLNVANDVSAGSFAMHRVKNAFSGANDALTQALLKKAQNLIELGRQYYDQQRPDSRYRRYAEPDFNSMLCCLVGVTDEVKPDIKTAP
jgi:hypothetical protein